MQKRRRWKMVSRMWESEQPFNGWLLSPASVGWRLLATTVMLLFYMLLWMRWNWYQDMETQPFIVITSLEYCAGPYHSFAQYTQSLTMVCSNQCYDIKHFNKSLDIWIEFWTTRDLRYINITNETRNIGQECARERLHDTLPEGCVSVCVCVVKMK